MRHSIPKLLSTTAAVTTLLFTACESRAQDDGSTQAVDHAFQEMIHNPSDATSTLNYATLAAQAGDLEGAIGALSRLLMSNPDDAEIHRQLGVLYRILGSTANAEMHDKRALELATTAEQRQAIQSELAALQSATATDRFAMILQTGLSYQTNSAIATQESGAYSSGQANAKAKPDENGLFLANASYSHAFDDALVQQWDSSLTLYATRQFRYKDDDISYARLTSGPTFALFGSAGSTLRSYLIGETSGLGQNLYLLNGGGGVLWEQTLVGHISSRLEVETTKRWFSDSETYPGLSQQDATLTLVRASLGYTLPNGDRVGLRTWSTANISQSGYASYREYALAPVYEAHFAGLWGSIPWLATAEGRYLRRPYREAVPSGTGSADGSSGLATTGNSGVSIVDSGSVASAVTVPSGGVALGVTSPPLPSSEDSSQFSTRNDTEWGGSVTVIAPITESWSVVAKFSQMNQFSTIAAFRYRNSQIVTSIQYNF